MMETTEIIGTSFLDSTYIANVSDNATYNISGGEAGGGDGHGEGGGADKIVMDVLRALVGSLGFVGNGIVLFVFFRDKSLRSLINSFIINQTLIDFVTSFVFLLLNFIPRAPFREGNLADKILCQIWLSEYVLWALFISSSMNLVCITLDRYFAIIYPARYRSSASKLQRRVKLIAAAMWASGFVFDCYWAAIHKVIPPKGCYPFWPNDVLKGFIGCFIFFITYAGPLGVMCFSYARILSKLRKQSGRMSVPSPKQSPVAERGVLKAVRRSKRAVSERSARATRNVIKTMIIVSLTYAICWAPIAFNYLIYNLGGYLNFQSIWYHFTTILVYGNMCANPFIYTMQYQQFQRGFERAFKIKLFGGLPDSTDPTKMGHSGASSMDGINDSSMQ